MREMCIRDSLMIEAGFGGIAHLCERGKGMRKKQAAILLTVAAAFLLAGCAVGPSADRNGEVLLGQGTALIARMQALSDEEAYLEWMLSSTQEMQEAVDQITAGEMCIRDRGRHLPLTKDLSL